MTASVTSDVAPATSHEDDEDPGTPLDFRLLLPGLGAWAVVVALLPQPTWVITGMGLLALLIGLVLLWQATGDETVTLRGLAALICCAIAVVSLSSGAQLLRDRSGPVSTWAEEGATVRLLATVTLEPRVIDRHDERDALVILEIRTQQVSARGQVSHARAPMVVMAPAHQGWEELRWRSTIEIGGRLRPADAGERAQAILSPRGPPEVVAAPPRPLRLMDHVRDSFRQAVQPLPDDPRGLVPGLVIGDTSLTPQDLTEAMRATGLTHLAAVSGSNIALICAATALLIARLGVTRRWRTPLILIALVGFMALCRPEPSVLRAGVMGAVGLLALSASRRRASLPALAVAVILLLCLDPWLGRSYGFALSVLATVGLVVWAQPWGEAIASLLPKRLRLMGYALSVPLAAQIACAPVVVMLQDSIAVVGVVANLLCGPLVAPTTVLGVLAAVLAPFSMWLSTVMAWAAGIPAWMIALIARVLARVPYGEVPWVEGKAGAWLLAGLTAVVLLTGPWLWHCAWAKPALVLAVCGGFLMWWWPVPHLSSWPAQGWVVVGCDVGQGDAFVVSGGHPLEQVIVIDTGPDPEPVGNCLRRLGVDRVDGLFLSHFHADHIGGLEGVLDGTEVTAAYVSPVAEPTEMAYQARKLLDESDIPVRELRAGDVVTLEGSSDFQVEVLSPGVRPVIAGSAANNGSLVLDVTAQGLSLLFTGDVEPEGARPLRRVLSGRDYDVIKVAHHGSAAQDPQMISNSVAKVALIGVGADNTFGHPAPSLLNLLDDAGMVVLRTDQDGDIAVSVHHEQLRVHRRDGDGR